MPVLPASLKRWAVLGLFAAAPMASGAEAEVLHYWRPDDPATLLLKDMLKKQGHTWMDFSIVPGGSNGLLNSLLKSRVMSGNPPFAAVIRAPVARHWAREGRLTDLEEAARLGQWDKLLPKAVRDTVKDNERYVAVPLGMYRSNWLWTNNRLLQKVGAKAPADWAQFFETAERLRRAGVVALAHDGGQQRQNLHLFETVALGVGGADFYRKAFLQREASELTGSVMEEVLRTFRRLKRYTQTNAPQRDWPDVSRMLLEHQAAMVIGGDWTGPLFAGARVRSGFDYSCTPAPGSAGAVTYLVDSIAMFRPQNGGEAQAQREFAAGVLSPDIQLRFSLAQGSIPVRQGIDLARFDACARQSAAAFRKAEESNTLLPSFPLALSASAEVGVADVVTAFWADDSMTPKMAMELLVAVMR